MARQKRGKVDPQDVALQRTLIYLVEFQPDVPVPISFLSELVGGDLMMEGKKNTPVIENLQRAPALFENGLANVFQLSTHESQRASVVVSSQQIPVLKAAIEQMGPDRSWMHVNGLGQPLMSLTIGLHFVAEAPRTGDYSPDELGLLASHGLYWLKQQLHTCNAETMYGIVQLYDALWMLCDEEAIAPGVLSPFAQTVIEQAEQFASEWGEFLPFSFLAGVGEEMAKINDPTLRPLADRALACCKHHMNELPKEERKALNKIIQIVSKSFT